MTAAELGLVVLAGGTSRRWGGRDKTAVPTADGEPLLAHVVRQAWLALGEVPTVVVAPADHPARVRLVSTGWLLEDPPGGGPVAGLAAGSAALDTRLVAVLAADLPQAGPALARLAAAASTGADDGAPADDGRDGAIGVDPGGRRQLLLAVLDRTALSAALTSALASGGPALGPSMKGPSLRSVLQRLRLTEVPVSAAEAFDLDTPQDYADWSRGGPDPGHKVNDG